MLFENDKMIFNNKLGANESNNYFLQIVDSLDLI